VVRIPWNFQILRDAIKNLPKPFDVNGKGLKGCWMDYDHMISALSGGASPGRYEEDILENTSGWGRASQRRFPSGARGLPTDRALRQT
jgi:hypothetical protein